MENLNELHSSLLEDMPEKCSYPVVDSHIHLMDFLQETSGLDSLLESMISSNIVHSVIFGIPVMKKWDSWEPDRPHYYLDDNARCYVCTSTDDALLLEFENLSQNDRKRFTPLLCGFNPTDRNAVFQVEKRLDRSDIWKGIGEIFCRHDDLTNQTMEETSRMNHSALLPVYDLAGSRGLPVLLHQNSTSVGHHDRFEYLHEVEEVLDKFPDTVFVWAHCGISRRVSHKLYHRMIWEVLQKYDNVHVDLSWVVYDQTVCRKNVPKDCWLKLAEEFPSRIMLGSDLCGHFDTLGKTMARYNRLLEMLSPDTRDMVCRGNAGRIWNIDL